MQRSRRAEAHPDERTRSTPIAGCAIEKAGTEAFTLGSLVEAEGLPFTQVAVAPAFRKERGIVGRRFRRNYAARAAVHLNAMTEYCALAENG